MSDNSLSLTPDQNQFLEAASSIDYSTQKFIWNGHSIQVVKKNIWDKFVDRVFRCVRDAYYISSHVCAVQHLKKIHQILKQNPKADPSVLNAYNDAIHNLKHLSPVYERLESIEEQSDSEASSESLGSQDLSSTVQNQQNNAPRETSIRTGRFSHIPNSQQDGYRSASSSQMESDIFGFFEKMNSDNKLYATINRQLKKGAGPLANAIQPNLLAAQREVKSIDYSQEVAQAKELLKQISDKQRRILGNQNRSEENWNELCRIKAMVLLFRPLANKAKDSELNQLLNIARSLGPAKEDPQVLACLEEFIKNHASIAFHIKDIKDSISSASSTTNPEHVTQNSHSRLHENQIASEKSNRVDPAPRTLPAQASYGLVSFNENIEPQIFNFLNNMNTNKKLRPTIDRQVKGEIADIIINAARPGNSDPQREAESIDYSQEAAQAKEILKQISDKIDWIVANRQGNFSDETWNELCRISAMVLLFQPLINKANDHELKDLGKKINRLLPHMTEPQVKLFLEQFKAQYGSIDFHIQDIINEVSRKSS